MKKKLNRIVFGLKLVERKSEKPKFLGDPISYLSIQGGGRAYRRPRLKQQKTLTEKHFIFSHFDQLSSLRSLGQSSEVECNPKMSISLFDDLGGLLSHFSWLSLLRLLSQLSEVEHNPKTSIHLMMTKGAFFCISVTVRRLDHSADHQKLNVIQKWAFYFFGWRGVADRVWVHWPARPIIRSWT